MGFIWDPFGIICAVVTYSLISYANVVVCLCFIWPWMTNTWILHIGVVNVLAFLATSSHFICMMSNPGALPLLTSNGRSVKEANYANDPIPTCKKCNGPKPPRAHHCSTCGRCIMKMDHHCPWVNNCVGQRNQKHFVLFLFYINIMSTYVMAVLAYRFIKCVGGVGRVRGVTAVDRAALPEDPSCSLSPGFVILGVVWNN